MKISGKTRAHWLYAACLAPLLLPAAALAQTAVEGVVVTAVPTNIETPTLAGSRLNIPILETPASVTLLDGDTIRSLGQVSIMQAESSAPGVSNAGSPGNGGLGLSYRGFTGTSAVMQLYDGTQLAIGSGTVSFPFSTWNVENIEVIGGPDSVLYGVGAIGGTINVVPRKPNPTQPSTTVQLGGGSFSTYQQSIDTTGAIGSKGGYRLDVDHQYSAGWLNHDGASDSTAVSVSGQYDVSPNLRLSLSDDFGLNSPTEYWGTPILAGKLDPAIRYSNFTSTDSYMNFVDNVLQFKADWTASDNLSVHNDLYVLNTHRQWHDVETYTYNATTKLVALSGFFNIHHNETQVGDQAYLTYKNKFGGLDNELEAGFDFNAIHFENANNSPYNGTLGAVNPYSFSPGVWNTTTIFAPRVITDTNEYAFFGEDRLKVLPNLSLVLGGRYDITDLRYTDPTLGTKVTDNGANFKKTFNAPSYRFGLVYNPLPHTSLYVQYATATASVGTLITTTLAQSQFNLATGRQFEGGVKQTFWDQRGQWTVSAFQITENNLLTPSLSNPTVSEQVGQQSSQGVEGSLMVAFSHGWRLDANGSVLQAKYDNFQQAVSGVLVNRSGKRPPNVPTQTANAWVRWRFMPNWEVRTGLQHVGLRYADAANTIQLPAYDNVGLGLRFTPTPRLSIDLRADNATDAIYPTVSGNGGQQWYLAKPRSVNITLNYRL